MYTCMYVCVYMYVCMYISIYTCIMLYITVYIRYSWSPVRYPSSMAMRYMVEKVSIPEFCQDVYCIYRYWNPIIAMNFKCTYVYAL